jgi:hypothetical protein
VQWLGHLLPPVSDWPQGFMCVCAQVSCSVVSNWPLCEFCGRVYCDILSVIFNSSILFVFWDTRRWIKSKSTIRSTLTHHRQNPTEITDKVIRLALSTFGTNWKLSLKTWKSSAVLFHKINTNNQDSWLQFSNTVLSCHVNCILSSQCTAEEVNSASSGAQWSKEYGFLSISKETRYCKTQVL